MRAPFIAVVGAGPAGSTAARVLAQRGMRVALIESRRLPRDKSCAGGLTPKARRLLPASVLETSERSVQRIEFRAGPRASLRFDEPAVEVAMVRRAVFDLAMVEAAAAAGVDIRDDERVDRAVEQEDRVVLSTRRHQLTADYVIAADGCPSTLAPRLGIGSDPERRSLALHAGVPLSSRIRDDTAIVSFVSPFGYLWYFPKADHADVGIGMRVPSKGQRPAVDAMRQALATFADQAGVDLSQASLSGHLLAQGLCRGRLTTERTMVVGDAAGMADPLFGEGISYAISTGLIAATTLLELLAGEVEGLETYDRRVRELFVPGMRRLRIAASVVEHFPTLALACASALPWVRSYGINVVAGLRAPFAHDDSAM